MSSSTAGRNDAMVMVAVEKSFLVRLEKVNQLARATLPSFFQSSSKIVEEKTPLKLKVIKSAPVRNSAQAFLFKTLSTKVNLKFKPIIVLDLDETMIFGADMSDEYKFVGSDYSFKMGPTGFHVKLRPGILKLLEFLQPRFELWVYSNGRARVS